MKVLKISYYAIMTLCVLFLLWFAASWVDIVADNCFPYPVHHQWNLFVLMTGWV